MAVQLANSTNQDWADDAVAEQEMSGKPVQPSLDLVATGFEQALNRLESGLAGAVQDIASMARRTGFEDGHNEGFESGVKAAQTSLASSLAQDVAGRGGENEGGNELLAEVLSLREALAASKARESALVAALTQARADLGVVIAELNHLAG